jgi:putative nucleotidyltransferase with HDIG domain
MLRAWIVGAAVAVGAGAVAYLLLGDVTPMHYGTTILAFSAFVVVAELLEIPLERGVFTLGLAPALAFAMLPSCGSRGGGTCQFSVATHIAEAASVSLIGAAATVALRILRRRDLRLPGLGAQLLVVVAAGATYGGMIAAGTGPSFGPLEQRMSSFGLAAVLLVVFGTDLALRSATDHEEGMPLARIIRDQVRETGLLIVSAVSIAALLALAYPALRAWTVPVFLAPLAATRYAFKQVATTRRNYLQTVRALSRVPEMAGYTPRGHSVRVAQLAVAIARELGIGNPELHEIEYASLLHDIGRISLPDPEEAPTSMSDLQLALVGAEIVENTGHFAGVANMVRHQHEPYRRRGEDVNRLLPTGAKVIKVASAYDDLTEPAGPGRTAWDALERLHSGMAYEFDPQVIQALTRVLERQSLV